ncbi:hypothetical protein MMC07_000094 [Pseudocyphellaria aurata]|nr:hypothetical protein [Pseudocyphellaria aurata]
MIGILKRAENNTYGVDLSKDWTNSTLSFVQTRRPEGAVPLIFQSLWFDDKKNSIYSFGGAKSSATAAVRKLAPPIESIWGFKANNEGIAAWYEVMGPISEIPFPSGIHRVASGMSTSDGNRAYYLGGYITWATSPSTSIDERTPSPGLLMFDFKTTKFTNSSDGGYRAPYAPPGRWPPGAMINVPRYGRDGVLVILPSGRDRGDFAFNNITLYDKENKRWYSQTTSGDTPDPRFYFCAAGVGGDQDNTFEIFVHGGVINNVFGPLSSNSDQVYVLSLPSFRWFRANYTSASSRAGHTCHITNNQLIMIGGGDPTHWDADDFNASADPWASGIGVFDLKALRFKDSYQAKANAYETPDFIRKHYDTAGSQYPSSWTSTAVKELFQGKSRRSLGHGAVAGIVVGCAAFSVICAAGAGFAMKRRSKPGEFLELSPSPHSSPSEPQELSASQRARELLTERQDRAEISAGTFVRQEFPG